MVCNVGGIDRILRIVVGAALTAWAALMGGPVWAWIGLLPLITGLIGICPAYLPFGIKTCSTSR
jgi:Inner membrane protein YgaP-like, transmembrane domain